MQPGGIRENFPEPVILSFLLKMEVKDRPAREYGTNNCLEAKRSPVQLVGLTGLGNQGQWAAVAENEPREA